jgi:hypothetical protein
MNNYVIISPLDQIEIKNFFRVDTPILEILSLSYLDHIYQNMLTIACLTIIYMPILGTIINCADRWLVYKPTKMRSRPGHTYTNMTRPGNKGKSSGDGGSNYSNRIGNNYSGNTNYYNSTDGYNQAKNPQ